MKSKAYWVKRAVEVETYLQSQADSVKDGVIKAYERAIKNVNNDIEKTFKAYISTDIPEKEARRLMSIADSDKQYEELLELYDETDDKTVKKEILNRINAQAYGARISRLEGLKRNVYIYFRHVANEAIKEQKKLYDSAVKTAYYTNIFDTAQGLNCGIDFSLVPQKAVNKVLSEPWHGHNYSERIWIHNDRFIQAVGQTIEDGIISGHSVSRMTDKLIDYVKDTAPGGIRTSAETLVRSETAHFMNQGQKMAYEEIGIKKYQFVAALSELTCDRCGSLDGSVFDTDKAVEGENFPPIHPRIKTVKFNRHKSNINSTGYAKLLGKSVHRCTHTPRTSTTREHNQADTSDNRSLFDKVSIGNQCIAVSIGIVVPRYLHMIFFHNIYIISLWHI